MIALSWRRSAGAPKRGTVPLFRAGVAGPEGRPPPRKEGLSLFFLARRFGLGVRFGDRVRRARAAVGDELVEHVAAGDQPAAVDLGEVVLVDTVRADLGLVAGAVVGHLEPLRAAPGAVAFDADHGLQHDVPELGGLAVLGVVEAAD